ncbi:hypothetical protein V502_07873 [Pseudogymnoascus sp. VKM F-4520 (FW-2644)]|nr:hypothetical protein V502_07873 [Pseudogymnoascus sp. VKM F-4520 (FW-2644)]
MKFNTMDNTLSVVLFTNILTLFSFLATVLASPILTAGAANSLAPKAACILGSCELGRLCYKAGSCFGVNLFNQDWSHCSICACPSQAFGGRTDPKCVMDIECLNVQLGNRPDPCAHKANRVAGREASPDPAPQRDGGLIDPNSTHPNIKELENIPESLAISNYLSSLPKGSYVDPEILKKLRDTLPQSHVVKERSDLINEFARLVDDGPGGPVTPDAAMMERLRPISHPEKRGGCYTVENGVVVEKRGGCGTVEGDIDIDGELEVNIHKRGGCYTVENGVVVEKRGGCGDIDVDGELDVNLHKRGGCYTVENGVTVEKRGGCGTAENNIDVDGELKVDLHTPTIENGVRVEKRGGRGTAESDIDIDSDINVKVEKRVGCFVEENGVVYAKHNCNGANHEGPRYRR